ncbi:hypothetical protein LIER_22970 [Lithospermum erythrorhizon]|uniref:Uncharacterized protein n=1 Tax=Lithospermum erythrorhizon TaxID=34254 RepID=A0AAV3QVQ6_LITER
MGDTFHSLTHSTQLGGEVRDFMERSQVLFTCHEALTLKEYGSSVQPSDRSIRHFCPILQAHHRARRADDLTRMNNNAFYQVDLLKKSMATKNSLIKKKDEELSANKSGYPRQWKSKTK